MPIDETGKFISIRVAMPEDFQEGTDSTIDIDKSKGIKARIAILKEKNTTGVRSYLFAKAKGWSVEKAKTWVVSHGKEIKSAVTNIMPAVTMAQTAQGEPYEIKANCLRLKDIDEMGKFQAFGAKNDNIDIAGDRFRHGIWKKTIEEHGRQFPLLHSHDFNFPLGSHWPKDTKEGLLLDPGQLDLTLLENGNPMVPKAVEDYSLYKSGHLDTFSVGWIPIKKQLAREQNIFVRDIKEAKLYEVSMVPIAMNDLARMINIKGIDDFFGYITANLKDKDLKYRIFSLYYPDMEPEELELTLQKACDNYFSGEEIVIEEPGDMPTPGEVVEPDQSLFARWGRAYKEVKNVKR